MFWNKQTFREDLAEFRASVLPRQFSQTFSEAPDSHTIRDKLGNVNSRYERLKSRCLDHRNKLADIQEKQQRYCNEVNPILPWLDVSYVTLGKMMQEPIAAEPDAVKQQIEQLKVSKYLLYNFDTLTCDKIYIVLMDINKNIIR